MAHDIAQLVCSFHILRANADELGTMHFSVVYCFFHPDAWADTKSKGKDIITLDIFFHKSHWSNTDHNMEWNALSLQDALYSSIYFLSKTDQLLLTMAWIIIILYVYGVRKLSWYDQN